MVFFYTQDERERRTAENSVKAMRNLKCVRPLSFDGTYDGANL